MDKLDILIWVMGIGFCFIFALMALMWHSLNSRMDRLHDDMVGRIDRSQSDLGGRVDRVQDDVNALKTTLNDVNMRLCRMEGSLAAKDCCMLKHDSYVRKAE